jgi:hypothetical protein
LYGFHSAQASGLVRPVIFRTTATYTRDYVDNPRVGRSKDGERPKSGKQAPLRAEWRRVAVGPPRPKYLLNEENDRMMMIILALAAEVSALRDRLDTHEALSEKRRFATAKAVEGYELPDARRDSREKTRQAMLSRVLRILMEDRHSAHNDHQQLAQAILQQETTE